MGIAEHSENDAGRLGVLDILVVVVLLAGAAAVWRWDAPLSEYLTRVSPDFGARLSTFAIKPFRMLGKADVVFFLMVFLCWATGNRRLLWRFIWAMAASGLVVLLLKVAVGRVRPNGHSLSFPSGDSQTALVWAAVLAAEYPLVAIPAFLSASGVAILRVTDGAHYPSDVLVGSALGFAGAKAAALKIRGVPGWFCRTMQGTRWGVIGLGSSALYVTLRTAVEGKPSVLILTAFVVGTTAAILAVRKRLRRSKSDIESH